MEPEKIVIFDTTLRDGEQSPGASMNIEEKLDVARQLARLGVDVIEAGFPISSAGDFESVRLVAQEVRGPSIAGLSRANIQDIDRAWEALQGAERARIHTFIATSDIHLEHKLKKTRSEVLELAAKAVAHARSLCPDVEFSPEDASRSDIGYLCEVLEAVIEAGATTLNIPDTVGYALPYEFGKLIATIRERVKGIEKAVISVHCHNDMGLAVANSLAAMANGARQVECTVNGIGERAGNTALEEIVMAINTRSDYLPFRTGIDTREIYRASRLVSEVTGIVVQPNKAVVGSNAFAHEAGIHQHGVIQKRQTYEIMDPNAIGLTSNRLVLGKHSGRHAFEKHLKELGYELNREELERAFARFKEVADKKKIVFDADLEAIVSDEAHQVAEVYHLDYMIVMTSLEGIPTATIRMQKGQEILQAAETGVGCVDAVYRTIDKLVDVPHRLADYNVKSVTGGTDAIGEVTVKLADNGHIFTGRGASLDIVEASARAYVQAINKLVYHHMTRKAATEDKV
ncbi:MAG: 2-isopropylmalate synthase [Armatimonadetes bacterium]|nr:2-isopropylmalate synthase [Armatimonadota bacterium]